MRIFNAGSDTFSRKMIKYFCALVYISTQRQKYCLCV